MTNAPTPKPYLSAITPYKAGKTTRQADITPVKLSSNENPYGASPKAIEAYREAAAVLHRYPESSCVAIRHKLAEMHHVNADNIVCGAGSDELIGLLIHAFAGAGDEVLFTEHAFLMYKIYTLSSGATPVEAEETHLRADVDKLLAKVSDRTKIVFLANPNNPTGSYLPKAEVERLRAGLPEHIILAIDGAYTECADASDYDDGLQLARTTHNTVVLRTFSKLYGLPALRLGWMTGHETIIDAVNRMRSPFNVNHAAQAAGLAALQDAEYMAEQQRLNSEQRALLSAELQTLGLLVHPSQGNFVLVDFGSAAKAQEIVKALEAQHIFIRDVSAYKLPTCLRISIGTVKENRLFLDALGKLL